jgi:hypothetical protein
MIRRTFAFFALFAFSALTWAQGLTTAQLTTVRTFACADTGTARPMVLAGDTAGVRGWLNTAGAFIVWRTNVTNDELGDAMNGTEVAGLSSLGMQRLQVLSAYSGGSQNMARADRRAAFDAVFSGAGGVNTRAAMAVLWKRSALRVEQALATGTGTTGTPGLTTWEGLMSETDSGRMLFTDSGALIGC